jgi:uncharacterized protein
VRGIFTVEKFNPPFSLDRTSAPPGSAKVGVMVDLRSAKVLVSGVSGPIGIALLPSLRNQGAQITRLTRGAPDSSPPGHEPIPWDPEQPLSPNNVSGFDAVIHLAGEGIVGRWTAEKKAKIRNSRVLGTQHLAEALARAKDKPEVFVSSSAIGFYGDRGNEVLTEESAAGQGFLPDVCREWEAATRPAAEAGIRTVQIRTGIVLSPKGGALGSMLTPFKMGVGGKIGGGNQWMSWIDVQDMVGGIHQVLNNDSLRGPVNMVAPSPVTNAEFTRTLASVVHRPAIFPVPGFVVKLIFGEMGETVLLGSQRVEPARLLATQYSFKFKTLGESLENLLRR